MSSAKDKKEFEHKIAALELQIKNLKRENYALRVRYNMQGQPPILTNNHVILCIGNAIFNYFEVVFIKGSGYVGAPQNFVTALFHLKAYMATCKLVTTVITNAVKNNDSYFLCYHYLQYKKHLKETSENFTSAFKYTICLLTQRDYLMKSKDYSIYPEIYNNAYWLEKRNMQANVTSKYNAQTNKWEFYIVTTEQEHMFASIYLPRKLHLFAVNEPYARFLSRIVLQRDAAFLALDRMRNTFHPQKTTFYAMQNKSFF